MRNLSVALFSLTLTLLVGTNAAWSESRIERDNRTGSSSTSIPSSSSSSSTDRTAAAIANGNSRFACETVNGEQTVVYRPQSRAGEAYAWAIPGNMGAAWSSTRRCGEISRRLESYRSDGLEELRLSVENRSNIVCVTTERNPSCRIVFTVPSGQDPVAVRDRVFRNLTLADSGQQTQGVNTFAGGSDNGLDGLLGQGSSVKPSSRSSFRSKSQGINLKPFLSKEDGGTGNQIGNPVAVPQRYRLNPDNFRK
jgi:hypothetical protein